MNLTIYGKPQPKERPKVYKGHAITPTRTKNQEALIRRAWLNKYPGPPLEGPITLTLRFYMPIPQSWSKRKKAEAITGRIIPTIRPDIDNLAKLTMDALSGAAFVDDKQIFAVYLIKQYSTEPRTEVTLCEIIRE